MPPKKIWIIRAMIPCILSVCTLFSTQLSAQSNLNELLAEEADIVETTTFDIDDYDVISSIYVFLTSGDERKHQLVLSLEQVDASGGEPPLPCSLDELFCQAIQDGVSNEYIRGPDNTPPPSITIRMFIEPGENGPPLSSLPEEAHLKVWTYRITWDDPNEEPEVTATHVNYRTEPEVW